MEELIKSFAIGGYRSFGQSIQHFDNLSKVNVIIGQNNSGKSNVIRFLYTIFAKDPNMAKSIAEPLNIHKPSGATPVIGWCEPLIKNASDNFEVRQDLPALQKLHHDVNKKNRAAIIISQLFTEKSKLDGRKGAWFYIALPNKEIQSEKWDQAFDIISDNNLQALWSHLTGSGSGGRKEHWQPEVFKALSPTLPKINTELIPAFRKVGDKESSSEEFDGNGLIARLARLQNPSVHNQADRRRFDEINNFLQNVIDNATASIEVPHERDTILVHMDGKTLPLESLGSGIHEVIILASAATLLTKNLVCIEEPEIHLNPILQKKLIRYLSDHTTNQYFITTHSAALMDTPGAEIYHVYLEDGQSIVNQVTTDKDKSAICEDLGYHPSDLLQSNCIVWVEGPSDRLYINKWLATVDPSLIEGIHYSIMFYAGRLAAHISGHDSLDIVGDFISLRRLNRRGIIVIDSDRWQKGAKINETKKRLKQEFDTGPGHAWITEGRELENYIPADQLKLAIQKVQPSAKPISGFGQYSNTLQITTKAKKKSQASKVEVARYITTNFAVDLKQLDLTSQVNKLVSFIHASNPGK